MTGWDSTEGGTKGTEMALQQTQHTPEPHPTAACSFFGTGSDTPLVSSPEILQCVTLGTYHHHHLHHLHHTLGLFHVTTVGNFKSGLLVSESSTYNLGPD